jgi:hypothetical protein
MYSASWRTSSYGVGIRLNAGKVTQMNDNVGTNTQRTALLDESAWKKRGEAEVAEAQLLLTPADEHLNERRIALGKLADEAEEAARRLREGGKADDE